MSSLRELLVGWVDDQISVVDSRFYWDVRWFVLVPFLPAFIALAVGQTSIFDVLLVLGLVVVLPWMLLVSRRRALKKKSWVEPTRYSDMNGGY